MEHSRGKKLGRVLPPGVLCLGRVPQLLVVSMWVLSLAGCCSELPEAALSLLSH